MSGMNLYGGPIEQNFSDDLNKRKKNEAETSASSKSNGKKDKGEFALTDDQTRELKDKYNFTYLSCEEETAFLQDLIRMGILTKADCDSYTITGGNLFDALTKQVNAYIRQLYQLAIAGRDSDSLVEKIRSLQKILDVLEQMKE